MNISDQLQKIWIFLAKDRFLAVLKQVTITVVSFIKVDGMSGQQATHYSGNGHISCSKKKMKMVWD